MILLIFDVSSIILKQELTDNLVYYFKYLVNTEQQDKKEYYENAIKKSLSKRKLSRKDDLLFPNIFKGVKDSSPSNFSMNKKKKSSHYAEENGFFEF